MELPLLTCANSEWTNWSSSYHDGGDQTRLCKIPPYYLIQFPRTWNNHLQMAFSTDQQDSLPPLTTPAGEATGMVERAKRESPWKSPHTRKARRGLYHPWGKMGTTRSLGQRLWARGRGGLPQLSRGYSSNYTVLLWLLTFQMTYCAATVWFRPGKTVRMVRAVLNNS